MLLTAWEVALHGLPISGSTLSNYDDKFKIHIQATNTILCNKKIIECK